jgi:hypothetical protein
MEEELREDRRPHVAETLPPHRPALWQPTQFNLWLAKPDFVLDNRSVQLNVP